MGGRRRHDRTSHPTRSSAGADRPTPRPSTSRRPRSPHQSKRKTVGVMTERRPGNLAHLERLISVWSREDAEVQATAGRLRRLVAVSVLATILDSLDHNDQPRLAFKGGASMEMRFGVAARASRDVDAPVNVSFDEAFGEIAVRLHTGWGASPGDSRIEPRSREPPSPHHRRDARSNSRTATNHSPASILNWAVPRPTRLNCWSGSRTLWT